MSESELRDYESQPLTDDEVRLLAETIIGTCDEPAKVAIKMFNLDENFDFYELPMAQLSQFDEVAWRCEDCDWWVDTGLTEDGKCTDCNPDVNGDS